MANIELLPCPLCAGDAEHTVSHERGNQNAVKCLSCGCRVSSHGDGCVSKWNTRPGNDVSTIDA